ncbi:MAG: peroxiredoxin family protein [Planctomycetota bacterium]
MYLLGALYFFRERYVASAPEGGGPAPASAKAYWDVLLARFPETEWARRVERPLRYLRLLSGEAPPDVGGTFELGGKAFERSLSELRGKVACLIFSRGRTRELRELESAVGSDLRAAFGRMDALKGRVSVLEIRLGAKGDEQGGARGEAALPWPVLYDPRGFESPFVRDLGIPYAPHFVVLDPEGRPAYAGGDGAKFRSALARELERWKGAAPESAR